MTKEEINAAARMHASVDAGIVAINNPTMYSSFKAGAAFALAAQQPVIGYSREDIGEALMSMPSGGSVGDFIASLPAPASLPSVEEVMVKAYEICHGDKTPCVATMISGEVKLKQLIAFAQTKK